MPAGEVERPKALIGYKSTHRTKFSELDPYNYVRTAVYAVYYIDHRMNSLREYVRCNGP